MCKRQQVATIITAFLLESKQTNYHILSDNIILILQGRHYLVRSES